MNRFLATGFLCLAFVLCAMESVRAEASFEIIPGAGYLTGYTRFEFGNFPKSYDYVSDPREPYFPVTEHKFPLMSGIASLDARATVGLLTIEGGVRQNFTHDPGMTRTYDWGKPYYDPDPEDDGDDPGWYVQGNTYNNDESTTWYNLDIETKSRTRMEVEMWNAKASCRVYTYGYDYYDKDWFTGGVTHRKGELGLSLGLGYEKRSFDFESKLSRQWSPSGHNDEYAMTGDGSVTETYSVDYSIPFVELGIAHRTERLRMDMSFGFSNLVHVSDDEYSAIQVPGPLFGDGHLSGNVLKFATHLQYDITEHLFVGLAVDYLYLNADGTMNQHASDDLVIHTGDGGPYANIIPGYDLSLDEKVKSEESCFLFNVGYRFGK